jgi:hypothetical protein
MMTPKDSTVVEAERKAEAKRVILGLCSACQRDPLCTFLRDPDWPVLQCDEFEAIRYRRPEAAAVRVYEEEADVSAYRGLCASCEGRESCTYARPFSGVWHCDEYE